MKEILDIFYNEVVPEAQNGIIDSYFVINILFDTVVEGRRLTTATEKYPSCLPPTLMINNKNEFDRLLVLYVELAQKNYPSFLNELIFAQKSGEEIDVSHDFIKSLLAVLWGNATSYDYINPCDFLRKRIAFLQNELMPSMQVESPIGQIAIKTKKEENCALETPLYLDIQINGNEMPRVYYGIFNNQVYIYAIQNKSKKERDKKLNRSLYKVNEGIDLNLEPFDNIANPENLRGITPATLLSAVIALSFFKNSNYDRFIIPTFLISRWNAKEIANYHKIVKIVNEEQEYIFKTLVDDTISKHEIIQRNLSDKLIRTFRRIDYHFSNINVASMPFIESDDLLIYVDDNLECNNPLLKGIYESINSSIKR